MWLVLLALSPTGGTDTPGNKVISGSDSCGSPCFFWCLEILCLEYHRTRAPYKYEMQTIRPGKNFSSLLLLKIVQREARFPDSYSFCMNPEVERLEEEVDFIHQEGNSVPEGEKVGQGELLIWALLSHLSASQRLWFTAMSSASTRKLSHERVSRAA